MISSKFITIILSYFIRFSHPRHGFHCIFTARSSLVWSIGGCTVLYGSYPVQSRLWMSLHSHSMPQDLTRVTSIGTISIVGVRYGIVPHLAISSGVDCRYNSYLDVLVLWDDPYDPHQKIRGLNNI